jgi:hypothetical protein
MCPLCLGTATLLASSTTTAGGIGALLLGRRARRQGTNVAGLLRKIALSYPPNWDPARLVRRVTARREER